MECVYSFIAGTGISHFVLHLALKVRNVVPGLAIPEKIRNLDALLRHAAMPGKQLFSQILGIRGWHPPLVHRRSRFFAVPFSQCECFRLWGANRQVLIDVV